MAKEFLNSKDTLKSLKIIDLEESQSEGGLKTDISDCTEILREFPNKMTDLWYKSNLLMRKPGKAFVSIKLINFDEDLHAGKEQCEVNLNQEEQIGLMEGMLEFEARNDEFMNENPEEEPGKRHLYISEMYMEDFWHKDYDVLIQEHNQLQ